MCPKIIDSIHTEENKCLRNICLFSHQQEKQDSVRAFSEIHACHLSSINLIMSLFDLFGVCVDSPIQHSSLAQGEVLTTSGGSTPTLRHSTSATLTVFIWGQTQNTIQSSHINTQIKTGWWIIFNTIKSLFMRENAMSTQTYIPVHPGSFIPVHHNLLLQANEAPLER